MSRHVFKHRIIAQVAFMSSQPAVKANATPPAIATSLATKKQYNDAAAAKADAGMSFPDFIEHWSPKAFQQVGGGLSVAWLACAASYGVCQETMFLGALVSGYWYKGYKDLNQKSHTILRNFPVLGNFRFVMEMIRPEIRQYLVESDQDGTPYDRDHRSIVYQRAKHVSDTLPFGTRKNVYSPGYEWANHSMYPTEVDFAAASRVTIGGRDCKQPYSASLLNIRYVRARVLACTEHRERVCVWILPPTNLQPSSFHAAPCPTGRYPITPFSRCPQRLRWVAFITTQAKEGSPSSTRMEAGI
jgi:hypothetical protein